MNVIANPQHKIPHTIETMRGRAATCLLHRPAASLFEASDGSGSAYCQYRPHALYLHIQFAFNWLIVDVWVNLFSQIKVVKKVFNFYSKLFFDDHVRSIYVI